VKKIPVLKYFSIAFAFICVVLVGCASNGLDFVIRYDDIDGLTEASQVLYQQKVIGEVQKIMPIGSGAYDVQVRIDQSKMPVITQSADFVIVADPTDAAKQVISLVSQDFNAEPVQSGDRLEGALELAWIANSFRRKLSHQWRAFSDQVGQAISELDEVDIERHIAPLESELDKLIGDMDTLGEKAKNKIQNDILPGIRAQVDQLRDKINAHEGGPQDDEAIDRLQEKLDALERTIEA
jgi:hypothetical protein